MSSRPSPVPADRPKSTLFCPECGHESAPDGDWVVSVDGRHRRYACPECDAVVEHRPRFAAVA
ncbi:MAG: hypothetical protein ABEH47_07085 [Haloferacaceae archaeon]